jgi:hypothetical protein
MHTLRIKPAEGKQVRDHVYPHPFISIDGCEVAEHPYWWRKLSRGDVLLCPEPVAKKTQAREA